MMCRSLARAAGRTLAPHPCLHRCRQPAVVNLLSSRRRPRPFCRRPRAWAAVLESPSLSRCPVTPPASLRLVLQVCDASFVGRYCEMGVEEGGSGTETLKGGSRAINDTRFRRLLTLAAVKFLARLRPRRGAVLFLTESLCVKYGTLIHLPEASTMDFIAHNTSIPVPKIYCSFRRKGVTYIVMERVKGEMIAHGWTSRSEESKATILRQLKEMIESMRSIPPRSHMVANIDGGALWDCRLPGKTLDFGPFDDINAFHQHLRGGLSNVSETLPPAVNELIELHDREWPNPVLTHGDLSSLNIIAEGDTITSIVDWETAGWYPQYWEYTTARQVNFRNPFWLEEVDKFLEPWPAELKMEELRQKFFGDV